jgi:hypothetical protein
MSTVNTAIPAEPKGNSATQAKKRWNASHYTQIRVAVDPDVASAFKRACMASKVSLAGKLTQFMAEYSKTTIKRKTKPDYSTKRQRRAAMHSLIKEIEHIRDAEEQYRDNIPENLQGSVVFDTADECVSLLEEAIELLSSIY